MIMAIGSHMMPNMAEMRTKMQQMQNFREGSVNLSKDDLTEMQSDMESKGLTTPEDLKAIIDSYDKIDGNNDGISYDELSAFAESNAIELGGPFSKDGPKGLPPGGPAPGGGPGMSIDGSLMMQEEDEEQGSTYSLLSSLLSSYSASDPDQTSYSKFSIYA